MEKKKAFVEPEQSVLRKPLHEAVREAIEEKAKVKRFRSTVDDWKHVLEKHLKVPSTLPSVIKGDFQDAKKLFKPGKNGQAEAEVTLRRKPTDEIVLPQFDPNLSSNAVVCRYPTCKNKNPDAPKGGKCVKRDLYLCRNHRERLKSRICEAMKKEGIPFHTDEFTSEPGRFEGYTSLISLFDRASRESKNETVREAVLNTRNFLIITSTLLNPDDDNLSVALPPVAAVTERIVTPEADADRVERIFRETIGSSARVQNLLSLLRGIIDIILFAFGVLYTWIVPSNSGGKIGAGIGGAIGLVGFAVGGPGGGAVGVILGVTFGGLIGSGVYGLVRDRRDDIARREWLSARDDGGDPDDGGQPRRTIQCTVPYDPWNDLRMYLVLSRRASNE